jgi:hypothetical protein
MIRLSSFGLAASAAVCSALVGCAGTGEPAPQVVVRTAAPKEYEKTITNYLAFRIRGSQKNAELAFTPPEPGDCPLDGHPSSARGWVVPVVYATRKGEPTGKETIKITTKQYYFWFLGDTIAGITPRVELCPGLGTVFADITPPSAGAGESIPAALASPAKAEGPDVAETTKRARAQQRTKAAGGKKQGTTAKGTSAKKPAAASVKVQKSAKAADDSHDHAKYELKW